MAKEADGLDCQGTITRSRRSHDINWKKSLGEAQAGRKNKASRMRDEKANAMCVCIHSIITSSLTKPANVFRLLFSAFSFMAYTTLTRSQPATRSPSLSCIVLLVNVSFSTPCLFLFFFRLTVS